MSKPTVFARGSRHSAPCALGATRNASLLAALIGLGGLGALGLQAGCGDDGAGTPSDDADVADSSFVPPDTYVDPDTKVVPDTLEPEEDTSPPKANTLGYATTMVGSDGLLCASSCALRRVAGEDLDLAIVYKDGDGRPLADRQIFWNPGEVPTDLLSLAQLSSYTDQNGVAKVRARSGGLAGSAVVTARASGDETAGTREFVITFDTPPQPDLAASFEYLGNSPLADFELRLYKQVNGVPSCAAVYPDAGYPKAPDLVVGPLERGRQARVQTLPGLATEGTQRWVVQFVGPYLGQGGTGGTVPLASGCVDNVEAKLGQTATALVYVLDLPKNFRGTYQTLTRLDVLSGGEGTAIGNILITLSDLFTHPGRLLVVWACGNNPSGVLGTVCYWITNSSGEPNFVGGVIVSAADAALLALLQAAIGENAQTASQLISEILRDLRLVSKTTFANEPATPRQGFDGAFFAAQDASEEWTHVRFRWKFDPSCKQSPDPNDCGWTQIPLEEIYGLRPTARLDAGIDPSLRLHILPHDVPKLTYGPLINAIIEKRLLGLLFEGGGDTPIRSWDDFVATLFGDRQCLDYDDCCEYFADKLEDTTAGNFVSWDNRVLACELAIPIISNVIRNQFKNLDGTLNLGTFGSAPCQAQDANSDRWIDGYGSTSAPCDWDLFFPVGQSRFTPDNDWRATRQ